MYNFFKRLFCRHKDLEFDGSYLVELGRRKIVVFHCRKCGKEIKSVN